MSVPKRRPPSAHSSSVFSGLRPQRAAKKPITVTAKTSATKMIVPLFMRGLASDDVNDPHERRRDDDPKNLIPVEERKAEEFRRSARVERRHECCHERHDKQ